MSSKNNSMLDYCRYVDAIEQLVEGNRSENLAEWRHRVQLCLDGEPGRVLRREVEIKALRQLGAFFTGTRLARRVTSSLKINNDTSSLFFDPTCGAGDLLLAIAKQLPISKSFRKTLDRWNVQLAGCDIAPEFVRLTKARLVLLAAKRCRVCLIDERIFLGDTFTKIVVDDFLSHSNLVTEADIVITNPPFGYTLAPNSCGWANGRISAAALFMERIIHSTKYGSRIYALLPEVLRSGTRYIYWRRMISSLGIVRNERSLGMFDQWADVDVYLLDYHKVNSNCSEHRKHARYFENKRGGVGRRFEIHVGSVVPHRHAEEGQEVPYVHARSLSTWTEHKNILEKRKFTGRLFKPPFVVVRRTSRPGGGKRANAALVCTQEAVAVENHLIVMLPKDGELDTCRALMTRLRSAKTDDWIDKRLRCRHLTTPVLSEMPWWSKL